MSDINLNEDFLKQFYIDTQNEMRWRREVEYKLLNNFILVVSFLISAQTLIYPKIVDISNRIWMAILLSSFLLILTIALNVKINSENAIYKRLGAGIVKVWEHFKLFEKLNDSSSFLNEESKNYGKGEGYRNTIGIFWILWVSFLTLSILLATLLPS